MKRKITWILIADGARARILNYLGRKSGVEQVPDSNWRRSLAPDRELDSDRPGRAFDSIGNGRHAIDPRSSARRLRKAAFARELVEVLGDKLAAGEFDRLVLIAPPKTLGDLREQLGSTLSQSLFAQVPLDLTHVRNDEIGRYLRQHVPAL